MVSLSQVVAWVVLIVLIAFGASLAVGGAILIAADGSGYYLIAGLAIAGSSVLMILGKPAGLMLFGLTLIATLIWSLWETGLNGWALAPRLIALALVGFLLLVTPVARRCYERNFLWPLAWVGIPVLACFSALGVAALQEGSRYANDEVTAPIVAAQPDQGEWRHWGRTTGGDRYSPLKQISTANVEQLELAWEYQSDVPEFGSFGNHMFQSTPLAADGRLYTCGDRNVVVALNPDTGKELWRFDPKLNLDGIFVTTCRGVAYYEAPQPGALQSAASGANTTCSKRIVYGTADGRLLAVDAETGMACADFGEQGAVDLRLGMGEIPPGALAVTSPPTVINGVVILGQFVSDFLSYFDTPSGVIRGYDAITGELRWAWDAGRPDRTTLPPEGESYTIDTPNAWGVFSGDETLGLVYVPTGNSPPDFYGAHRSAASEKYSSSIVAIDVATGKVRWSFQTVHHDLWDYDVPSQPVVADLQGSDGMIPALIAPTKRGQLFVLDRRDGTPVDRVVEKPVPQGATPGDWTFPTQPYTTGFPSLAGEDLTEASMWGMTPLDQLWCRIKFRQVRYDGQFTPPSTDTHINYPGSAGGSNWGSVTVDKARGLLVANSLHMAETGRMLPRSEGESLNHTRDTTIYQQEKIPYVFKRQILMSPLGVPCQQPPYGKISVFNLHTRELLWSKPLGTAARSGPWGIELGLPILMGVPNSGGSIATAGGLIFIGAAQDRLLRAFDIGSGKEVWQAQLPAVGAATPMTYLSSESGRQFVVISAGGHAGIPGPSASSVMAYALPVKGSR